MSSPSTAALVANAERYAERDGVLVGPDAASTRSTVVHALMDSPLIARVYEGWWRPALVRLVSPWSYAVEDAFVDRHLTGSSGLRVLDLCCGTARASRRLIPRAEVLGIDRSSAMLREARRCCSTGHLVLVEADAALPIARAATFDAAVCFAALHLLRDPAAVVRQAARALRPAGVFLGWVVARRGPFRAPSVGTTLARAGVHLFEPGDLASALGSEGFRVLESGHVGVVEFVAACRT